MFSNYDDTLLCLVCLLIHMSILRILYSIKLNLLLESPMRYYIFSKYFPDIFKSEFTFFPSVFKNCQLYYMVSVPSCFRHHSVWVLSPVSGTQTLLEWISWSHPWVNQLTSLDFSLHSTTWLCFPSNDFIKYFLTDIACFPGGRRKLGTQAANGHKNG